MPADFHALTGCAQNETSCACFVERDPNFCDTCPRQGGFGCGYCDDFCSPENHQCGVKGPGQVSGRIINGTDADACEWVWQVRLRADQSPNLCGGSLVSPGWVLTAAQCVDPNFFGGSTGIEVVVGDYDRNNPTGEEQVLQIAETILHPEWNNNTAKYDVALLRLKTPARLGACADTVCLPGADETAGEPSGNCFVTGWGYSDAESGSESPVLQELAVQIVPDTERAMKDWVCQYPARLDPSTYVFVEPPGKKASICTDDVGGPLMCETTTGRWTQLGVASITDRNYQGDRCSTGRLPSGYADLTLMQEWIQAIVAGLPPPAIPPSPSKPTCDE